MDIFILLNSLNKKETLYIKERLKQEQLSILSTFLDQLLFLLKKQDTEAIKKIPNYRVKAHRLYTKIINELILRTEHVSVEQELLKTLSEVDFFYQRNLFQLAIKRLHNGKKILAKINSHYYTLLFLRWESILKKELPKTVKEDVAFLTNNRQQELNTVNRYISESITIRYATYYNLLLSRHRLENEKILNHHYKHDLLNCTSLKGEDFILACNNNAFIYFYQQQYSQALRHFLQLVDYMESFKQPEYAFRNDYFMLLNNLMLTYATCGDYENVYHIKNKIYKLYKRDRTYELPLFKITENYLLSIYCETKDLVMGKQFIPSIETKLKKFKNKLPVVHLFFLYFNLALMHFYLNQYKNSLRWCTNIMYNSTKKKSVYLSNIFYYAHFLFILNHYAQNNFNTLPSLIHGIKYDLKKIKPLSNYEKLFLNAFQNITHPLDNETINTLLNKLKTEREKHTAPPTILQFINIEEWLIEQLSD